MQYTSFNRSWLPSVCARVSPVVLAVIVLGCLGCEAQTPPQAPTPPAAEVAPAEADLEVVPTVPSTSGGTSGGLQIQETFGKGLDSAAAATQWASGRIGDAADTSSQAASDAMSWAGSTFNSLKEQGLTTATDTSQWLRDDWKNMGGWEYKVVNLAGGETMEAKLNELGGQHWECFFVQPGTDTSAATFYFKKPSKSFLKDLPMRDALLLLPFMNKSDGQ